MPSSYYDMEEPGHASNKYFILSGTSMATAVVSGAAALMLQQEPALTPDQVKARLMKTAFKQLPRYVTVTDGGATYDVQADVFTVGAGYLDVQAALSNKDKAQYHEVSDRGL